MGGDLTYVQGKSTISVRCCKNDSQGTLISMKINQGEGRIFFIYVGNDLINLYNIFITFFRWVLA